MRDGLRQPECSARRGWGVGLGITVLLAACATPPAPPTPLPANEAAPTLSSALANVLSTCGYLDAEVDPAGVSEILPREYMRDAAEAAEQQLIGIGLPGIAARVASTYDMTPEACFHFVTGPLREDAEKQFERVYGRPAASTAP